ncbi:hypothetical protein HBI56_210800 [Parastagonospora nodorum]|uniref:Uncharacterized protein n=1 Tax=Phaeosphaeria nodorum (strain SN15 / ATCC MYA-4574 / FGSC 10173) TaxID=321614 RepID=A0A7U2F3N1_PHANO|nr:hypothetical protein HBH56_213580 [Parastagonospora nodorum]QRC97851.1 hypothetical protein JI435_151910 [Parastagonospora nodorum SN15]KAH3923013.1 hypothetical protein HBH54_215250 [Parastagonospora nodorum]KAH3941839.1 hypothetical protein HBH53_196850 [Parastagonospora nodorum]KAH3961066.1 hypothetical protein HBH51_186670 [Parastagonospora nodorum]
MIRIHLLRQNSRKVRHKFPIKISIIVDPCHLLNTQNLRRWIDRHAGVRCSCGTRGAISTDGIGDCCTCGP